MNLLSHSKILNLIGPVIGYSIQIDEIYTNTLSVKSNHKWRENYNTLTQNANKDEIKKGFVKDKSSWSGIQFKPLLVEYNTIYELKFKVEMDKLVDLDNLVELDKLKDSNKLKEYNSKESNENKKENNPISPVVVYIESESWSENWNKNWTTVYDNLIQPHSKSQFITLHIYIPPPEQLQGNIIHHINVHLLFNPLFYKNDSLKTSASITSDSKSVASFLFDAESFYFLPIQHQVCFNSVTATPKPPLICGRVSPVHDFFAEIILVYTESEFYSHLCWQEFLRSVGIQIVSHLVENTDAPNEVKNLTQILKYACDKELQNVLILFNMTNLKLHSLFMEMLSEEMNQVQSQTNEWSILFLHHLNVFAVNGSFMKTLYNSLLENQELDLQSALNMFSDHTITAEYPLFISTENEIKVSDKNMNNDEKQSEIEAHHINEASLYETSLSEASLLSAFSQSCTRNILYQWQNSKWNKNIKWNKHNKNAINQTKVKHCMEYNCNFNVNHLVTVVISVNGNDLQEAKLAIDLTLLNLLIQNYTCWSVLICASEIHLSDLQHLVDVWNKYLKHWMGNRFDIVSLLKVEVVKVVEANETNEQQYTKEEICKILLYANGTFILFWNPFQFFYPDRISKQICAIYTYASLASLIRKPNVNWKEYYDGMEFYSQSKPVNLYESLLTYNENQSEGNTDEHKESVKNEKSVKSEEAVKIEESQHNSLCVRKSVLEKWIKLDWIKLDLVKLDFISLFDLVHEKIKSNSIAIVI